MIVGAPNDELNVSTTNIGIIRVYQFIGGDWVQQGQNLFGSISQDQAGNDVSISNDGTIIAYGVHRNNAAGNNAGKALVYAWDGMNWVQQGADILGEDAADQAGFKVALSGDGSRVIITSFSGDVGSVATGQARVFEFNGTAWVQMGTTINGQESGEQLGRAADISEDGLTIAIGSPRYDGGGSSLGRVQVYQYDGMDWQLLGNQIVGTNTTRFAGWTVALNDAGDMLAATSLFANGGATSSGLTRTFKFDGTDWNQLGQQLTTNQANALYGFSLAFDSVGKRLVLGSPFGLSGNPAPGFVQVYDFIDTTPPVVTCAGIVDLSQDALQCFSTASIPNPVVTDNYALDTFYHDGPDTFLTGMTSVTWTALDEAGNMGTCMQIVRVTDQTPPQIICLQPETLSADSGSAFFYRNAIATYGHG